MKKMVFGIIPFVVVLAGCAGGAKPAAPAESSAAVSQTNDDSPGPDNNADTVIVTTLAGNGEEGYADGTGTAAQFNQPQDVAVDGTGNVYVAEENQRIRKISPEGVVTTLAGSGERGYADGTGAVAKFYYPRGVAVDGAGNVYVAEENQRIRKISPKGVVTTLAGSTTGYADGTGTAARFHYPKSVAADGSGNVYVGDSNNHRIRKISPEGAVSTLAGSGEAGYADGPAQAAQFSGPRGVTVDGSGNIYVADGANNRICKISPDGVVTTLAGITPDVVTANPGNTKGYANGTGAEARFRFPGAVAVDRAGNVYVADVENNRIRKISPEGMVSTLAGSGEAGYADGPAQAAQFNYPLGVAVDESGNIYVADRDNHCIRKITITTP
jgi:sugar lactone lactonase YvrE